MYASTNVEDVKKVEQSNLWSFLNYISIKKAFNQIEQQ